MPQALVVSRKHLEKDVGQAKGLALQTVRLCRTMDASIPCHECYPPCSLGAHIFLAADMSPCILPCTITSLFLVAVECPLLYCPHGVMMCGPMVWFQQSHYAASQQIETQTESREGST